MKCGGVRRDAGLYWFRGGELSSTHAHAQAMTSPHLPPLAPTAPPPPHTHTHACPHLPPPPPFLTCPAAPSPSPVMLHIGLQRDDEVLQLCPHRVCLFLAGSYPSLTLRQQLLPAA